MPSTWIKTSNTSKIEISGSRNLVYDLLTDPRFQDADKTKVAAVLKEILQADLEFTQRVIDLPDDDPDKAADPAKGERMFWRGGGGPNRLLVSRSTVVESCVWDGERYVFTLRRAR